MICVNGPAPLISHHPPAIEAEGRQVPLSPEMFALQLAHKKFTSRGDKITVVKLYTETSLRMLRGLTKMSLDRSVKMGPGSVEQLVASIQLCQSLTELELRCLKGVEMQYFTQALPNSLEMLDFSANAMGDAGAVAVAAQCAI